MSLLLLKLELENNLDRTRLWLDASGVESQASRRVDSSPRGVLQRRESRTRRLGRLKGPTLICRIIFLRGSFSRKTFCVSTFSPRGNVNFQIPSLLIE